MAYAQVDDGFYDHPKVLALLDEDEGLAAIGLWSLFVSYAHRQAQHVPVEQAGRIPGSLARRLGGAEWERLTELLTTPPAGYKHGLMELNGSGWVLHDFAYWQWLERAKAKSEQSRSAANTRWRRAAQAAVGQGELDLSDEPGGTAGADPPAPARTPTGADAGAPAAAMHITSTSHDMTSTRSSVRRASETPDRFDEFWETYPRRVGKINARLSWDKVMAIGVDPGRVIAAAARYRDRPGRTAQYTAHPATWLNQGRWEDDDDPGPGPGDRTGSFPFE